MKRTTALKPAATLILLLGAATQAQAIPMLRLTTDTGSVTVIDGAANDANAVDGAVVFLGELDGWTVNVTTGLSKPLIGSDIEPSLDLNSVNVNSTGAGNLRIELTDTDFMLTGETMASAAIGGVTDGLLSYRTFFDASNTAFGQSESSLLNDLGTFGPNAAFSSGASSAFLAPALYSLTMLIDIAHTSPFNVTSFNATLKVPEPSSIALLGAGLLMLAGVSRRRRARDLVTIR